MMKEDSCNFISVFIFLHLSLYFLTYVLFKAFYVLFVFAL